MNKSKVEDTKIFAGKAKSQRRDAINVRRLGVKIEALGYKIEKATKQTKNFKSHEIHDSDINKSHKINGC